MSATTPDARSADAASGAAAPLLSVENLRVDFATAGVSARVVEDMSFSIAPGERFALVGESGSGKTVTAYSLLRLHSDARYGGRILFDGRDLLSLSEREMRGVRGRDIAMVFQEPMSALNPLYSIGDQICETIELHEGLPRAQAAERALRLLERVRIAEPRRRFASLPHQLSGGQRQRAMIAMALACHPRLLVADEPTTALDVTLQRQIVELLAELQREMGMAVLLITHDLPLVRSFADRVAVMQSGRLVETGPAREVFDAPRHPYTRRLVDSRPRRDLAPVPESAPVLLRASGLGCRFESRTGWFSRHIFEAVQGVGLQLARGETLGIVGESGSGKTTLGMALLRLSQARTTGAIELGGVRIDTMDRRRLRPLRRRMQVVFQDPYNALSPRLTVEEIVGEGLALHRPELDAARLREAVVRVLEEVGLTAEMLNRYPHEFSGGQRQRIAIARAVVLQPELLLLDEPTSSLDVSVQRQVLELLSGLQRIHGMSYLFITHDLQVVRAMAHRVMVMKDGRVVEAGETESVFASPVHPYTRELLAAVPD
ncbi:ABC transporter ATP-binding protein [Quisquiliibacterium transsilvanicum]|uniref:Microcin C transport system ATP-binding protein n=1 Tax=Quisquiliibacterium transsilvanicum TaxID=1549638 RepID=A0A7W8MA94_9BURK|nr:dipeptide ABC transporter ATP-binding protein [Quisquiliibacterium transsilvanicum]MBB5273851.1 microcin C transport system ATP-binding protein [Quisquiliibacterium transsilvanicum]